MSEFLAESTPTPPQSSPTFSPTAQVNPDDIALMQRVFNAAAQNPQMIPDALMSYVLDWLQVNNLQIPIGQVFGFQKFLSTQVSVFVSSGPSSFSGTIAAGGAAQTTTGPTTPALPPGKYIIIVAADAWADQMSAQINVATLNPLLCGFVQTTPGDSFTKITPITYSTVSTLTSTIQAGGNSTGGPQNFAIANVAIVAVRYDNV